MIGSLKRGLGSLWDFSGRDRPGVFWPYAATVMALTFVGVAIVIVPTIASSFEKMQRFAAEHPDQAVVTRSPGQYSIEIRGDHPELAPDLGAVAPGMGAVMVVAVLLLAAAVTRRLHDRGKSGLWGLLPLPFLSVGLWGMSKLFASFGDSAGPPMALFLPLLLNNFAYMAALLVLILLLAGPSAVDTDR